MILICVPELLFVSYTVCSPFSCSKI